jgi:hypothetical protein
MPLKHPDLHKECQTMLKMQRLPALTSISTNIDFRWEFKYWFRILKTSKKLGREKWMSAEKDAKKLLNQEQM